MKPDSQVSVPYETASIIRDAFLPSNPNKMRKADPRVVQAAKDFIKAVQDAKLG